MARGLTKPPYAQVFLHVLTTLCGVLLPSICTTTGRALAMVSLLPATVVGLALRLYQGGLASWTYLYLTLFVLIVVSMATLAFLAVILLSNRIEANPEAWAIVKARVQAKRIIQDEKYDIFLPPMPQLGDHKPVSYPVGFFVLPGALVQHQAYAGILSQLSDAGILVVIQNCEPLRVASESYLSSPDHIAHLIQDLATKHGITAQSWALGGHSLGGYTAVMIVKKRKDYFQSIVMYGVNRSYEVEKMSVRALAITASNDGLQHSPMADMSTYDSWKKDDFNSRLFHVVIQGGNHGGFGDYPRQTFPLLDGERTIPLEEQHRQIVEATVKFLLPKQD